MPTYRRFYVPNAIVFITCVTKNRKPIFKEKDNRNLLMITINNVKLFHPFELIAFSFLYDHIHLLIQMQNNNYDFSTIVKSIKGNFTTNYKKQKNISQQFTLWQKRFWDHIIRDENDFKNHLVYIHWNPVKHGYVNEPNHWEDSSFIEWVEKGVYDPGWGKDKSPKNIVDWNFE